MTHHIKNCVEVQLKNYEIIALKNESISYALEIILILLIK